MNFGKKQIIMLSLLVLIIAAGYLQYNYNQVSPQVNSNSKMGEAVFVEGEDTAVKSSSAVADEETAPVSSKEADEYFAQAKLDMDNARSQGADELARIVGDKNADKEIVKRAYEAKMKLVQVGEKEVKIENLIKKMGFSDALAMFSDDGSIDVIVKAPSLNEAQTAQITDIVSRYANISDFDKIHVKHMF